MDKSSATKEREGHCLCGAVKIRAKAAPDTVGACHCSMCRCWGGGPFMQLACGTAVEFTGEENVATFSSSDWAERGFCRQCGSHLFYRLKEGGQHMVPVGLFETDDKLEFGHQVFVDERPHYYEFANRTHDMTGAEVFAKFGGSS